MKRGKSICKTLKQIRKQVADANEIQYEPTECHYEGDCLGTCPKCEQEVRYIERQLDIRRALGKAVTVAGVSVGLAALSGCKTTSKPHEPRQLEGDVPYIIDTHDIKYPLRGKVPEPAEQRGQESENNDTTQQKAKSMVVQTDTISEPMVFGMPAEQMPYFRDGEQALEAWIQENKQYPEGCRESGRVIVSFMIQEDGTVTDGKVIKSVCPELDQEALRLVSIMPKWAPGSIGGKRMPMRYTMPVTFNLE